MGHYQLNSSLKEIRRLYPKLKLKKKIKIKYKKKGNDHLPRRVAHATIPSRGVGLGNHPNN
jgi:hypothetical protein